MLKVDRGRGAVVLADGVPRRGIEIAAQILLEQRFAGRAWRLALALNVRAQEELRIRRDQPLRQGRGLDQEEPPKIPRRELLVGPRVHGCGRRDVEHRDPLHGFRVVERHPVRDPATTVMPDHGEALEPEPTHDLDLIGRHGALAVVHMPFAAVRLSESP